MVSPQGDSRRRVAEGYQLASECLSAALAMVLPVLGGLWLDNRWNCSPWLTIGCGVLGMWAGLQQLLRLGSSRGPRSRSGGPHGRLGQPGPPPSEAGSQPAASAPSRHP
ncbi:MAG: AtpZ/AtpI family protein [Planctomycetaceae bacterium]